MFEQLIDEPRIVVTGPQRSGTRIAAQMVAEDIGHRFVDESEFRFIDEEAWREILVQDGIVVQCPTMFKPIVDDRDPGLFVVMMRRDLAAIHASQERIGWKDTYEVYELHRFGLLEGDSAALKYEYWDSRPRPPRYLEVEYGALADHSRFVPTSKRAGFGPHQTSTH